MSRLRGLFLRRVRLISVRRSTLGVPPEEATHLVGWTSGLHSETWTLAEIAQLEFLAYLWLTREPSQL